MKFRYLFLAVCLGTGCAAKKLAVTHADIMLENQIEKRLPLYDAQKKDLSKDIDKFLNDQKEFAREAIPVITGMELDVKSVDDQYNYLRSLYQRLALNFSLLMSKYMGQLDEKQQKDFLRTLKEENFRIETSKNKERMAKLFERFEILFGSISEKQKSIFESYKTYFDTRNSIRAQRRRVLHERFAEIYEMDLSKESKTRYFYEAFQEYQKKYPESGKNLEIIKKIIPTLSVDQKETFETKTQELREILGYYLETHY